MKKTKETEVPVAENDSPENKDQATSKKAVNKVGSLLKEMRLQKGLRIPDVSKKLCIRKIYLEAIEDSNYEEIPPLPYGIGFIRSYAEYLGLNSSNIVELYKEETNTKSDNGMYVLEAQDEATLPGRKYLLISLLAVVAIYAGWHFYNRNLSEETLSETVAQVEETGSDVDMQKEPLIVEDYTVTSENTEVQTSATDEVVAGNSQVVITEESFEETSESKEISDPQQEGVVIKVKEETWVEVKDKNKLYLSKVLPAGTEYIIPEGGKGMVLSVGKVSGAEVYINGKLTSVARPNKKTNIALDPFLIQAH
ncbi:MAG: helix-turn-helix domain-containing protein [Alphaproteobacteria bacterium]|nr:helix-turn-helix domain-containing protein [Alphaproteobacteria bacterium]